MSVQTGVEIDHSSARISGVLAVMSGLIAVVAVSLASTVFTLLVGFLGVVAVATGVFVVQSRTGVVVGSAMLFVAVLVGGLTGAQTPMLLAGTIGAVLSMDLGQNAVSLGRQMTTDAYTRRGEFVHATGSVAVGVLVAALAYGVYVISSGGQPVSALVLLVFAAVLLSWSFRT
ncbi:MAG: hypothetical protein ABEJ40_02535 [Haloarculaceae archaeon]